MARTRLSTKHALRIEAAPARVPGGRQRIQVGPILASTSCRFRRPLTYPDDLHVGVRTTDIGEDRFTIEYRLVSERLGEVAAEGEGVVVAYDYQKARKATLPPSVRRAIEDLEQQQSAAR